MHITAGIQTSFWDECKEAREAKSGDFIDNSLLQELENSGWFKSAIK